MTTLQGLVDKTPAGGTLDLGTKHFDITESVIVHGPITITGKGAGIALGPSPLRELPNFICRGPGVVLTGSVTLVGSKPTGVGYEARREAQHGLELQGVTDFSCDGWRIQNTRGDAVYVGKHNDRWSQNVSLSNIVTNEIGRQHVSLVAVHTANIQHFHLAAGYRSVFDIEPPGHDWGASDVVIAHGRVTSTHGFLLACKGVGDMVRNVHLNEVVCHNRLVNAMVVPPDGKRRQQFAITNCTSDVRAHSTPLRFHNIDGLIIEGNTMPVDRGVVPAVAQGCTNVHISGNTFAPSKEAVA